MRIYSCVLWIFMAPVIVSAAVTFRYTDPAAQSVALAGEFSGWRHLPMQRDAAGVWTISVELAPGVYGYKFVVNGGTWVFDPAAPARKLVDGIENSAIEVGPAGTEPAPLAAPPGTQPVTFVLTNPTARVVCVAGDFNGWNASSHPLTRDDAGIWRRTVPLSVGMYHAYKFIVDGDWQLDPGNPDVVEDGQGNLNSVVLTPRESDADPVYLPNTAFHDIAQRVFVVEAARVLAWRQNQAGQAIAEITYTLTSGDDGAADWQVVWRDRAGQPLRERTIRYPATALTSGAAFYRDVLGQLCGEDWRIKPAPTTVNLGEQFWQGAAPVGWTRLSGLRAAAAIPDEPPAPAAARRAGALAHAALPAVAGTMTLDGRLLARAAAWLCVAELLSGQREESLWAPVLFASGRVPLAEAAWGKTAGRAGWPAWWALMAKRPTIRAACELALQAEHRAGALPFLAHLALQEPLDAATLSQAVLPLLVRQPTDLEQLYEYAPFFVYWAGVGGGHLSGGRWQARARREWVQFLAEWPSADEVSGCRAASAAAWEKCRAEPSARLWQFRPRDPSVEGFEAVVPLLPLADREGWGPLTPVATVSQRDWLWHGWEQTATQLGSRHYFAAVMLGAPQMAERIAGPVTNQLPNLLPFFDPRLERIRQWDQRTARRVESMDDRRASVWVRSHYMTYPVRNWPRHENMAEFVRRNWLRPHAGPEYLQTLHTSQSWERHGGLLERLAREGGRSQAAMMVARLREEWRPPVPGRLALVESIGVGLPLAERAVQREKLRDRAGWEPLAYAQAWERLHWQKPDDAYAEVVFSAYVAAHAHDAARRFYQQAREAVADPLRWGSIAAQRFMLAWWENDEAGIQQALEDGSTGSYRDFVARICHAAARDQRAELAELVEACIERYEQQTQPGAPTRSLQGFLPLLPALGDPQHPDHERALDYFKGNNHWPALQWILLTRHQLSAPAAVRFLGGRDTGFPRRGMVLYLLGDKAGLAAFLRKHDRWEQWPPMTFVVTHALRHRLEQTPVPAEQPDLRPPGAESLGQFIRARLPGQ